MAQTSISANIVAFREAHGWTRADFQRRLQEEGLNVHLTTLRRIELGEQEPKLTEASHYADALGVSLDDLLRDPGSTSVLFSVKVQLARAKEASKAARQAFQQKEEEIDKLKDAIGVALLDGLTSEVALEPALDFLEQEATKAKGMSLSLKAHGDDANEFRELLALPVDKRTSEWNVSSKAGDNG